jgi:hypothetical protein
LEAAQTSARLATVDRAYFQADTHELRTRLDNHLWSDSLERLQVMANRPASS